MSLFTNIFPGTYYRFTKEVVGTSVDDNENPRFPDDTPFESGTEFQIVRQPHAWAAHLDADLFYTILVKGSEYNVRASDLDRGSERLAGADRVFSNQ